jgi:hypothetical protein
MKDGCMYSAGSAPADLVRQSLNAAKGCLAGCSVLVESAESVIVHPAEFDRIRVNLQAAHDAMSRVLARLR